MRHGVISQPRSSVARITRIAETPVSESDFQEVLADFNQVRNELHCRRARQLLESSLRQLQGRREQQALGQEAAALNSLLDRLDRQVLRVAVFGLVGRGKSSLLNALIGHEAFVSGPTHGVTREVSSVEWQLPPIPEAEEAALPTHLLLLDTPGIDEVEGEEREALAQQVAQQADLILFVIVGDLSQIELDALLMLREANKPMLLVFNKADQYPATDRAAIHTKLANDRLQGLISPDEIVFVAAAPRIPTPVYEGDRPLGSGSVNCPVRVELRPGAPQVQALIDRLQTLIAQDGPAMLALNTLLSADGVNRRIVSQKLRLREREAQDLIWQMTLIKGGTVALNPVMLLDVLGGAAVDVVMILRLSSLYSLPMTEAGAMDLLKSILLGLGALGAGKLVGEVGLGTLKSLLGLAASASGGLSLGPYLSVALSQAAIAGVTTYSVGQMAKTYLANGATWGPQGPKAQAQQILDSLDQQSLLQRIKTELRQQIGQPAVSRR
jgi:GTPase